MGGVLQLVGMLQFLNLCRRLSVPPETYWFPPTVSIAAFIASASHASMTECPKMQDASPMDSASGKTCT